MLVSNQNEKKTALGRFTSHDKPIKLLNSGNKKSLWGLKPRNKEQIFAIDKILTL
jgi:predicted ribonuclease YlaK